MAKLIRIWSTDTNRNGALAVAKGLKIDGRELQLNANSDMFSIDSTSGLMFKFNNSTFNFSGNGLELIQVVSGVLPSQVVFTDGSRPFTAPMAGVDAVGNSDLTTLGQVNTLIQNAITGDFSEVLVNLAGETVYRGQVGYVEGVSGSFQLAQANNPATAKVQYICAATTSIADGASGAFQNPSTEIDNIASYLAGANKGDYLYLSTTNKGLYSNVAPTVSGETVLPIGWKVKEDKLVFFPGEAIDL